LKINFRAHRRRRGAAKSNYNLTKITRSNLTRRFRYDKCNNLHVRNNSAPDSLLSMFVFLRSLLDCRLRGLKRNKSLQQLRHTFMCGCCLRTRFLRGRTPLPDAVRFFFHVCPPDRALPTLVRLPRFGNFLQNPWPISLQRAENPFKKSCPKN
jgi:hypothetical protein